MLDFIYQNVEQSATLQVFGIFFVLFIVCVWGFEWRKKKLGCQIILFDARFWYTPLEAQELLKEIGDHGRRIYAFTQITLDVVFPFVYGGLISIMFFAYSSPKYLFLIPIVTVIADLLENITTAYLAWSYKGLLSQLAWAAAIFTAAKYIGLILSFLVILFEIIVFLR